MSKSQKRPASLNERAPTNAYQAFALERRPLLPNDMRRGEREKLLGQLWKALTKTEKDQWTVKSSAYTQPNPYHAFCKKHRSLLPPALQNQERDIALGQMWRALSETERAKYKADGSRALPGPNTATALLPPTTYAPTHILGGHWNHTKTAVTISSATSRATSSAYSCHPSCSSDDSESEPGNTATAPTAQFAVPPPLPAPSDSPLHWTLQAVMNASLHATLTASAPASYEEGSAESELMEAVLTDIMADEEVVLELQSIQGSRPAQANPETVAAVTMAEQPVIFHGVQGAADSTASGTTPPGTPPRPDPEWLTELFDNLDGEGGAGSERKEPHLPVGSPAILNHGQDSMAPRTARLQDVRAEYDEPRTTAEANAEQLSVQPTVMLGMRAGDGHPPANLGRRQQQQQEQQQLQQQQAILAYGQSNMTPEQQAISVALRCIQVARTDVEVGKVARTLAYALGATRVEVGTIKALHGVLL